MKNLTNLCLSVFILMTISCNQDSIIDTEIESKKANKSTVDVINPILGEVTGTSTLHRTNNGITVNYKTTGLTPGYAYTLWIVIWNSPENCATPNQCNDGDFAIADLVEVEVLYGGGHVVGNSGKGNFSAHLNEDDVSGSINDLFGLPPAGGLQSGNSLGAEVHFVLRSHGPKIPGMVSDQISSYEGGCTDPFAIAPFTEIPDAVGECGDIEFAIHAPVN
jgi:hypothetical protein